MGLRGTVRTVQPLRRRRRRGWIWDPPILLRFAAVVALAGGHLAGDDRREKRRVNDADGAIFQGGELQRGAYGDGDYIHGSDEARAHNEGGPFKVFIQDQVSWEGSIFIIAQFNYLTLQTKNPHILVFVFIHKPNPGSKNRS